MMATVVVTGSIIINVLHTVGIAMCLNGATDNPISAANKREHQRNGAQEKRRRNQTADSARE